MQHNAGEILFFHGCFIIIHECSMSAFIQGIGKRTHLIWAKQCRNKAKCK